VPLAFRADKRWLADLDQALTPAELGKHLAAFAREELGSSIASGEASPQYTRYVNGQEGESEDRVLFPGPIVYEFDHLAEVGLYAVSFLENRSPKASGHYAKSHVAMTGGLRPVDLNALPPSIGQLIIVNTVPYSRKINVGAMQMSVPPFIYEDAQRAVLALYREIVNVDMRYIELPGGYRLKRSNGRGKNRQSGQAITYPALVISPR